jgi:hypothetical protein
MKRRSVQRIIRATFGDFAGLKTQYNARVNVVDDYYNLVELQWVLKMIETDPFLSPDKYQVDVFDCDDFAMHLRVRTVQHALLNELQDTPAVGFVFTKKHAFSLCIDPNKVTHIIDTTSQARSVASDKESYADLLDVSKKNPVKRVYI